MQSRHLRAEVKLVLVIAIFIGMFSWLVTQIRMVIK